MVRALAAATLALAAVSLHAQAPAMTVRQAVDKIIAATGATPPPNTVDTYKAGNPDAPLTGIVTTFMDTMPVLERAVALHANLVVTHEPTFYNHPDDMTQLPNDPVTAQKLAYIRDHGLVVWRFHDTWHARKPDGILVGVVEQLGWQKYQDANQQYLFHLPPTTAGALAAQVATALGSSHTDVIGDKSQPVRTIVLIPGAAGLQKQTKALSFEGVDALVAGESAQWEGVAWTLDAAAQGRKKALILVGHEASEEPGMKYCAEWLKPMFPGVPVTWVSAGQPWAK